MRRIVAPIVLVVLLLVAGVMMHKTFAPQKPRLHALAPLRIPKSPTVYLPGVLEFPHITTSVLGAQTINPEDIVTYVNKERMDRNALPLRIHPTLMKAAQMRAAVILSHQNFSHQDPYEHIQLDTVLPLLGYTFSWASENIGMGEFSAQAFVRGFMNSPSHRDNLLNPLLRETGVALAAGPYKQYYVNIVVQLFAIPASKEDYHGYTQKEIEEYKKLLSDVEAQLRLTQDLLTKRVEKKEYYEGWQKILIRQREILVTLIDTMKKEQPFVSSFISLIEEFNTNWSRLPKPAT